MTTEQGQFNYYDRPDNVNDTVVLPAITDVLYADGAQITDDLRAYLKPAQHESIPNVSEPMESHGEPQTPSWSYGNNPLFAALPADVEARMAQESTPIFDGLTDLYAARRLRDRILSQVEPEVLPVAEYTQPEIPKEASVAPSLGSVSLMTQALRVSAQTEAVVEPTPQVVVAADLPTSHAPYSAPVPLWYAPRRMSDNNVGLENAHMRGPLPDSVTPRLAPKQPAVAPTQPIHEAATAPAATSSEVPQAMQGTGPTTALLERLARQAEEKRPDGEVTQVIDTKQLAHIVASEQGPSAGQLLATRVAVEATTATIEGKPAASLRSYGKELLRAAGFRFRMRRDESGKGLHGEIVDETGEIQVGEIDMTAKDARMNTVHKLVRRMGALGIRIPRPNLV